VQGDDYKPSTEGTLVYLNGGKDLETTLSKVEAAGGKIFVPKTQISPEMGYFAVFMDSEGNKMALHSIG
jgi:predicted enzyme related to lactoylglutathione lyase